MRLFIGDNWAEDHHDVEVMDEQGKVLARARPRCGRPRPCRCGGSRPAARW
jgi:hypothetical protein